MRPIFGETPPQRPRASDNGGPTAFFIGDEDAVDAALEQSLSSFVTPRDPQKQQQQQQQQHGLSPTESGPSSPSKHTATHDRDAGVSAASSLPDSDDHPDDVSLSSDRPHPLQQTTVAAASTETSRPITPLMLSLSGAASAVSGVSSRRNSVAASLSEEVASQALSMSGELQPELSSSMMDSGSAPQLVMPSIKMPSRRPFTDEGKRIGRLKLLIAGDSGTGKTALIKAIVQTSDAIVHVDPITPQPSILSSRSSPRPKGRSKSSKTSNATNQISEISASTKPYPEWWSDLDDSRLLKRRKSFGGDTILDRNICFIDTPGYSGGSSSMETITPVIHYVESHFEKVQANALTDPDLLNMLGGDGGNQVDAVLYLIQNKLKPADLKYLQLLAPLTNVIPLLAQADTMTPEAVSQSKERIRSELKDADVRPFSFTTSAFAGYADPVWPYAVSSLPGSDHDVMDASLLMSPDYVQPLIPSDLTTLVEQIFCESGSSWLRHAAAKKFLQWKNSENPSRPRALYRPLSVPTGLPSASLVAAGPARTYSLARIADHTQREERMAQIRLANWASELQKSLANERARYEALARGERAIWLTEKLNECVQDGTLVAVKNRDRSSSRLRQKRLSRERRQDSATMPHQDPLGLLEVASRLKHNGWIALEVLGGVGILGGVAFWASKSHGWHIQTIEWAAESWSDFWNSER